MNKHIKVYSAILLFFLFAFTACKKEAQDPGGTAVRAVAGEWWVQLDEDPGNYVNLSTYNSAANIPTEMWFDEGFYPTKTKVTVNTSDLTFSASKVNDPNSEVDVTISKGKILQNAAKGPTSKAVTDSISYEVEYSDEPGTIYKFSGYRRTRFAEDDH